MYHAIQFGSGPVVACGIVDHILPRGGRHSNDQRRTSRRIQQGERDLFLQLWEQVQRSAHDRAYKWFRATNGRGGQTVQDLEQEAFLALLEALEGWDEKAGPFLPWYSLRLKAAFTAATAQKTQRDRLDPLESALSLF